MKYNVEVTGLGGPAADFHVRSYQVEAASEGAAVDKAIRAYLMVYEGRGYQFNHAEVRRADSDGGILVIG